MAEPDDREKEITRREQPVWTLARSSDSSSKRDLKSDLKK
jgi:hypothetical protein